METIFSLSNVLVLPFWLLMILLPGWRWTARIVGSPLIAVPPAVVYTLLVIPRAGTILPAVASPALGDVAALLGSPEGATVAWAHFLAFDLFVGRWAYLDSRGGRDAGAAQPVSAWLMAPVLFLILILGPLGLLLYLCLRAAVRGRAGGPVRPARTLATT